MKFDIFKLIWLMHYFNCFNHVLIVCLRVNELLSNIFLQYKIDKLKSFIPFFFSFFSEAMNYGSLRKQFMQTSFPRQALMLCRRKFQEIWKNSNYQQNLMRRSDKTFLAPTWVGRKVGSEEVEKLKASNLF